MSVSGPVSGQSINSESLNCAPDAASPARMTGGGLQRVRVNFCETAISQRDIISMLTDGHPIDEWEGPSDPVDFEDIEDSDDI